MVRRSWSGVLAAGISLLLLSVATPVHATLVAVDVDTGVLYEVSPLDASLSLIGPTGVLAGFAEIAFDPTGNLYGFTIGTNPNLYAINAQTGAATLIGPLNIGSIFEGGLTIAPDGTAYGTNAFAGSPGLFTIDLNTGAATLIGGISGGGDINGLIWRSDGMLVALQGNNSSLSLIDPTTAVSSPLAPLATTVGPIGGMTLEGGIGYFSTAGPLQSGSNSLFSFDLFTGASTLIGSFAPTISGNGISGLAGFPTQAPPPVPEPLTLLLFASGLAGLTGLSCRRHQKR